MRFSWHRLVVLLVLSMAALQVFHMSLLSRVENIQKRPSFNLTAVTKMSTVSSRQPGSGINRRRSSAGDVSRLKQELMDMADAVRISSVLDSSGDYKIINNVVQSDRNSIGIDQRQNHGEDVTLVTQCSADQLYHVSTMAEYWTGPISVAVFVADNLVSTLRTIWRLRNCVDSDKNNANTTTHLLRTCVSFHLVYPLIGGDDHHGLVDFDGRVTWTCDDDDHYYDRQRYGGESLAAKVSVINYERGDNVPYPNNLLRNVARQNAVTEFVFVVDVDMVPSRDLRRQFVTFAQTNNLFGARFNNDDKSAYVVPAYELLDSAVMPDNKRQLLDAVTESRARPFYVEVCAKCQKHTDYATWEREPMSSRLEVLFDVLWKDPWEPFYLAPNTVPAYDERFKQYGFNRISQVCEAHVAGYKFSVLNNAFLVHKGLKTVDSFHKKKALDQERNRLLFRQFKVELKDRYPESFRRCY